MRICPPWTVPSTPVEDICVPKIVFQPVKPPGFEDAQDPKETGTEQPKIYKKSNADADTKIVSLYKGLNYRKTLERYETTAQEIREADITNKSISNKSLKAVGELALHLIGEQTLFPKLIHDIVLAWDSTLVSMIYAILVCLCWVALVHRYANIVLWTTLTFLTISLALAASFCYNRFRAIRHSGIGKIVFIFFL